MKGERGHRSIHFFSVEEKYQPVMQLLWCTQWVMLLLSIMFLCYERPWTAARGSARQLYAPRANTWHHLGLARPRNISRCHWLSVTTSLISLKLRIILSRIAMFPAGQQLCNKRACQVMSDQTNDGWLIQCSLMQESASFKKKLWRGGDGNLFLSYKRSFLTY